MFEYFQFMDVLCRIKKYFIFIIVISLALGGAGYSYASAKNAAIKDEHYVPVKKVDVSVSELYFVSGVPSENSNVNPIQYNRDIALMISSMLNAEHTRQTVYEAVIKEIKAEELIASKTSLQDKYADKIVTNAIIGEFVYVHVLDNTSILRINVNSENDKLSEMLLSLYKDEFTQAVELVKSSNVQCSYSEIADTKIGTESEKKQNVPVTTGKVSTMKYAVLFGSFGAAVCVAALGLWTLLVPVVNRREDLVDYDTKVIVDKRDTLDFAYNNIENNLVSKDKLAVIVCRGNIDKKKGTLYYAKLSERLNADGIATELCYDISSDFSEFTRARECGSAVIIISYSNTTHKELSNTVRRLRENSIDLIGCVIV